LGQFGQQICGSICSMLYLGWPHIPTQHKPCAKYANFPLQLLNWLALGETLNRTKISTLQQGVTFTTVSHVAPPSVRALMSLLAQLSLGDSYDSIGEL
jgi:hypothetical protein